MALYQMKVESPTARVSHPENKPSISDPAIKKAIEITSVFVTDILSAGKGLRNVRFMRRSIPRSCTWLSADDPDARRNMPSTGKIMPRSIEPLNRIYPVKVVQATGIEMRIFPNSATIFR